MENRNYIEETQLHRLLKILDKEVTGKCETHKTFKDFPKDFAYGGVKYYLSDGRSNVRFGLRVGPFTGHLFINDNSITETKEKFQELYLLKIVIETFFLRERTEGERKNDQQTTR